MKAKPPKPQFIKLPFSVYDSDAFQALLPIDVAHLLRLLRKFNGRNNGAISLGLTEACARCRCSRATSGRSLRRLQEVGLISATARGHATGVGKPDIPTRWKINFVESSPPRQTQNATTKDRVSGNVVRLNPVRK